ncbi:hypothetical protein POM88_019207 [Heracleum sosnowskyi]|uniref:Uncharacterized protein n=1 Tax=Heracleum sosnowskyi TaxID=360622 RepID=A0AAD8IRW9_9APIA|nr:hypothetical protein POM88_019207 [Heracleum sosnowskyi]
MTVITHQQAPSGGKKDVINAEFGKMHLNMDRQQQTTVTRTSVDGRREEGKVKAKNTFMQKPPPYYLASRKSSLDDANNFFIDFGAMFFDLVKSFARINIGKPKRSIVP